MKRNSIRKASNFKLQAARSRFQGYLEDVQSSAVARKWPSHLEEIRKSSEAAFEMCYGVREGSPFLLGLNYDCRYSGFRSHDNMMVYRDYLGRAKKAFLFGDFNGFDKNKHQLTADEEMGEGWWTGEFDLNEFRLDEGSKLMVRMLSEEGKQHCFPPPSCFFVEKGQGVFRKYTSKAQHSYKHKISHLLAYTIDLQNTPLSECITFIEAQMDLLQCFNTVIIKNLFTQQHGVLHKFSLAPEKADLLQEVVGMLTRLNIKVVLEWNFEELEMSEQSNQLEEEYFKRTSTANYQFDLKKETVLTYCLTAISHYIKYYGIGGIHFTKVHKICQEPNGQLLVKLINLLCERLKEDSITLASSKQFIPGLTWPILQGGLGFSFTYNFHESLSLSQQHQSIYQMIKQIQSSSNCLSLDFTDIKPTEYIYLLFSFLISRKGVFTRGPVGAVRDQLKKVLKLRRQEELFNEQCTMQHIDEDCMLVSRGNITIVFNFSQKALTMSIPLHKQSTVVFNNAEQQLHREGEGESQRILMGALSCVMLQGK